MKTSPNHSPMMQQYHDIKQEHPDCLLFYRMGDFYELFFDDAIKASKILDITLTKRGKNNGDDIPMCGVPVHAYDTYLLKLLATNIKVAVCEQLESPADAKKRGNKGPLSRGIVRIITPGTLTEETLLDTKRNNFLLALSPINNKKISAGYLDFSTQEFYVEQFSSDQLQSFLERIDPAEILLPDMLLEGALYPFLLEQYRSILNPLPKARFSLLSHTKKLCQQYGVQHLDAFNLCDDDILATGTLLDYMTLTQKKTAISFPHPKIIKSDTFLQIDQASRKSLEIVRSQGGGYKGSLLHHMDKTETSAGARLLCSRLSTPLQDIDIINHRFDEIDFFLRTTAIHKDVITHLKRMPDIERGLSRLHYAKSMPKDLGAIREALRVGEMLSTIFLNVESPFSHFSKSMTPLLSLKTDLEGALSEELPLYIEDGFLINEGYSSELDQARFVKEHAKELLDNLEKKYIEETGITNLRIKYNNLISYYIEVTPSHLSKVPDYFIQKQKISTACRYTTKDLSELEEKIINASHDVINLEKDLFSNLCTLTLKNHAALNSLSHVISAIDVGASHATLSRQYDYVRPVLVDDSTTFIIEGGRHPVVERSISETFHKNDCAMDNETSFFLLTGPNMAGKSTYLRQNALIILMSQMGCFVPATKAKFGIVDRLFSRVGASDDISSGRSTFMVEMVETATILHQSTEKSFVILDEIGRGTATYDGVSLAFAVSEFLHEKKSRTLFATHYHELNILENDLNRLKCLTIKIKEWDDQIIFLHEVIEGAANKSYGIHVAKLAGIPDSVLNRAKILLQTFERQETTKTPALSSWVVAPQDVIVKPSKVEQILKEQHLDNLTPRQALDLLYVLKSKMN